MEIQELRILISIAELGTFKAAAKKMGLTQPAVSQSLANLERKLGEQLIDRRAPLTPTPVGNELLRHAQMILESESNFLRQLALIKLGKFQTVSLAVDHLAANYYCPKIVKSLTAIYPEAELKIERMAARKIIPAIKSGLYSIGVGPFQRKMAP